MGRIEVTCSEQTSIKCRGIYLIGLRAHKENLRRNGDLQICLFCSRYKKSGSRNPNVKYFYDRSFFKSVDTEEKAYLLGWIASDGAIETGRITIAVDKKDKDILETLRDIICEDMPVKYKGGSDLVYFSIYSKEVVSDVCYWLNIDPGAKSHVLGFPTLNGIDLQLSYIRGLFDGGGHVSSVLSKRRSPRCSIGSSSPDNLKGISEVIDIPCYLGKNSIEWSGNNALDFLGKIYDNASVYLTRKRDKYIDWCMYIPSLRGFGNNGKEQFLKWTRTETAAVPPYKNRVTDSGYDLTLLKKVKQMGNVHLYTTGIKITPEYGWYFDLVGRSSIIKSGYMLANGFGVIDRTYVGPILVPLIKVNQDAPDLQMPNKLVQLIPRPIVHFDLVEVNTIEKTSRSGGGFGSTGQ